MKILDMYRYFKHCEVTLTESDPKIYSTSTNMILFQVDYYIITNVQYTEYEAIQYVELDMLVRINTIMREFQFFISHPLLCITVPTHMHFFGPSR